MVRILWLLLLTALCVKSEGSWDIAVITKHQLEFYLHGTKLNNESTYSKLPYFTALAYDGVYNNILFANSQYIFKYGITTESITEEAQMASKKIGGVAYNPVTEMFFWTDILEKRIYRTSLFDIQIEQNGSWNDLNDNLLVSKADDKPLSIAVDICRGYIYWTNKNMIKRARFDGTDRKTIVDNKIDYAVGLAIDQKAKKIYWVDKRQGIHYRIESADLNGENRKILLNGTNHQPYSFTISNDSIYWVDLSINSKAIWKLPKDPPKGAQPTKHIDFSYLDEKFGITANYPIREQIDQDECKALTNLFQNNVKASSNMSNVPTPAKRFKTITTIPESSTAEHAIETAGPVCKRGVDSDSTQHVEADACHNYCLNEGNCSLVQNQIIPVCHCLNNYSGSRCETLKEQIIIQRSEKDACFNYCLNEGNCSLVQNQILPVCYCLNNYSGSRCETLEEQVILQRSEKDACFNYCLNEGNCSLDLDQNTPICNCLKNYSGSRCEIPVVHMTVCDVSTSYNSQISDNSAGDSTVIVLGVLVALLGLGCIGLITVMLSNRRYQCTKM